MIIGAVLGGKGGGAIGLFIGLLVHDLMHNPLSIVYFAAWGGVIGMIVVGIAGHSFWK
jgi:hypothetical protein